MANTADIQEVIDRVQAKMTIEGLARKRYGMGSSGSSSRYKRYRQNIKLYAPIDNDQWPEDKLLRPSKIHITANLLRAYVDIIARLLSLQPRIINKPASQTVEARQRAEIIERFFYRLLELSGWDVWMIDFNTAKEVFGLGILKPYWNNVTKSPDVSIIEQPQNLMLGYGANDFSVVDWSIYRYTVSFIQAESQWPDAGIEVDQAGNPIVSGTPVNWAPGDKADIVDQRSATQGNPAGGTSDLTNTPTRSHLETYEQTQHLEVWDYWYLEDDKVMNAILLAGRIVDGPNEHPELPIIPYLVSESGHEPGSPEGMSTAELLRDVQHAYNRSVSQWAQQVADNSGTAYQITGPTAGDVPEGVVPRTDEMLPVGENQIIPIQRNQNAFPISQLVDHYKQLMSDLTGIPQVLFGQLSGAQTSGRATAVQVETALNRLDPKRRRLYSTLRDLLRIWGYMLSYKDIKIDVTVPVPSDEPDQPPQLVVQQQGMKQLLDGFDNWKIVAPEITPRDDIEATQNAINKVNSHLSSLESAMDEIGVDNPRHELDLIRQELSDARLNPGQVQAFISALQLMLATEQQQQAQDEAAQNGQNGQNVQSNQDQQAQPGQFPDQNQPGVATGPGGAPPPGAPPAGGPVGLELQGLLRQGRKVGGQVQALSQVKLPPVRA